MSALVLTSPGGWERVEDAESLSTVWLRRDPGRPWSARITRNAQRLDHKGGTAFLVERRDGGRYRQLPALFATLAEAMAGAVS